MTRHPLPAVPAFDRRRLLLGGLALPLLAACGGSGGSSSGGSGSGSGGGAGATTLTISAIPDQDPELLNRLYGSVADGFAGAADLEVEYRPVTDYTAVVRAFQRGDVYLAWMGGLTGVQARALVEGATAIAQRDIDADFRSLFIANRSAGLEPFEDVAGLTALAGKTLTFGSETSTSGRLMPTYFMEQAGLSVDELAGPPGFSGSHDATIEAVASGAFEVGAVNEQVWAATEEAGEVDVSDVVVLFRTPGYADYHWLARPDVDEVFGAGTTQRLQDYLLGLDVGDPEDAEVLELFGAESFVEARDSAYDELEEVARAQGLLE
ncbi:putative selenate ABC transporter substrate-binding protein [Geodermatophilus sp. YIM 151500]|uniref:putative selenate ABC transporter substrate-binding protein n=1 Tax=Geodermatophilus sp. YIM 151500 TaxID=2984531 RepID=UPI0021E4EF90|nr:putative selenate ABC transporter substrate-binding protein [Geodermatophilus sp. YIM 151500]MCV2490823.1 putative selenate ABC transporter substrate-binding protein [Geodermatophilus sp. YIM 151500]